MKSWSNSLLPAGMAAIDGPMTAAKPTGFVVGFTQDGMELSVGA